MYSKLASFILICLCTNLLNAQKIHTPKEILDILEKSTLSYKINQLEDPIPLKDQTYNLNTSDFYRIKEGANLITKSVKLTEEAVQLKKEAEVFFRAKKYAEARSSYEKIKQLHPEYSKLTTYIGQTYFLEGNVKKSIRLYKEAIDQNPIDYIGHWFLARSYVHNKDFDKALDEYLTAHILNRNHKMITSELQEIMGVLKNNYENWTFNPQFKLSATDSLNVEIFYDSDWMSYALTKAVWAYEPGYRVSMGLEPDEEISILEEKEALASFYLINTDNKKVNKQPFFKALDQAFKNKQFDEFILYEILLVKIPFIAYQLPDVMLANLRNYILETRSPKGKGKRKKKRKK
jgi:tetratricopeptide (TPR) repeat protein